MSWTQDDFPRNFAVDMLYWRYYGLGSPIDTSLKLVSSSRFDGTIDVLGCDIVINIMTKVLRSMPAIVKTFRKHQLSKPNMVIYRPKYRYIGDYIGLICHRCQHPKISTPSTSTIRDIKPINIDVSKYHYHQHRQN
jgi:hypothetical protein